MTDATYHVIYKAIADFSALYTEAAKAQAALKSIEAAEGGVRAKALKAVNDRVEATRKGVTAERELTGAVEKHTAATEKNILSSKTFVKSFQAQVDAMLKLKKATEETTKVQDEAEKKSVLSSKTFVKSFQTQIDAIWRSKKATEEAAKASAKAREDAAKAEEAASQKSKLISQARAKSIQSEVDALWKRKKVAEDTARAAAKAEEDAAKAAAKAQEDAATRVARSRARAFQAEVDALLKYKAQQERIRANDVARAEKQLRDDIQRAERRTAREIELAERRARREAEVEAKRVARDVERRRQALGPGGNAVLFVASAGRALRDGFRDADHAVNAIERVRVAWQRMRAEVSQSGGGGSGVVNNLFTALSNAGDRVGTVISNLGRHMLSFRGLIILAIAALGPLIAVLGALGAAALAVGNSLISLAGSTAALPGLFLAAAAGVGALVVALGPLLNVFKAYGAQQKLVHVGASQLAESQRESAAAVLRAQRAYLTASRALSDAQFEERRAQQDLNEARRQATRDLQDLQSQLAHAALDEEGAILAVKQAKDDYLRTLADENASDLDREQALHRIKEAELALRDIQIRNNRLQEDANRAQKLGVEGSEQVVDARRRAQDATLRVTEAVERLQIATEDLAKAQKEQAAGGAGLLKANQALQAALEQLGPKARIVALAILEQGEAWRKAKIAIGDRVFDPIVPQVKNLVSLMPVLTNFLEKAGAAIGVIAAKGIEMLASGPWKRDFATLAESSAVVLANLGEAALYVADAFRHITVAAAPFTQWVSAAIKGIAKDFVEWAERARENGSIAKFLDTVRGQLIQIGHIVLNLVGFFAALFGSTKDFTTDFLDGIEKVTAGWKEWAEQSQQQGSSFQKWLKDVRPLLSEIWKFLSAVGVAFAEIASDPRNIDEAKKILDSLAKDVLPAIVAIFTKLSESHAISDLVEGVGHLFTAVQHFLEKGGTLPLQAFAKGLLTVAEFWVRIVSNPAGASIIYAGATALGAFAAAAAIGKFTGLFALIRGLRSLLNITSLLPGRLRAAAAATSAFEKAKALGGGPGGVGSGGLTGAAEQLILAARELIAAAVALQRAAGIDALTDVAGGAPIGGRGKPRPGTGTRGTARGVALAAGEAVEDLGSTAIKRPGFWARAGRFAKAVDPLTWAGLGLGFAADEGWLGKSDSTSATLGRAGGAVLTGAGIGATIGSVVPGVGTAVGGVVGGIAGAGYSLARDPKLRELARSPVGQAVVSPVANLALELFDNKELRDKVVDFFKGIGDWFVDTGKKIGGLFTKHVLDPIANWAKGIYEDFIRPFLAIWLGVQAFFYDTAAKVGGWLYDNVIAPFLSWLGGVATTIGGFAAAVANLIYEHFTKPILDFFVGVGTSIGAFAAAVANVVYEHFTKPVLDFFVGIGSAIVGLYLQGQQWVYDHITKPVFDFFSSVGTFIRQLPKAIEQWAESLPGVGPYIKKAYESLGGGGEEGKASGGMVSGARDGRVDNKRIRVTPGEFVVRQRVVDKPGAKELLTGLNEGRLDPTSFYTGLNSSSPRNFPLNVPMGSSVNPTTVNNDNSRGVSFGDITINNPIRERSDRSLRRTVQSLVYMNAR